MPQEAELYHALLGDLTDQQLVELFGAELKKRGRSGLALSIGNMEVAASTHSPTEWGDPTLFEQLTNYAAYVNMVGE